VDDDYAQHLHFGAPSATNLQREEGIAHDFPADLEATSELELRSRSLDSSGVDPSGKKTKHHPTGGPVITSTRPEDPAHTVDGRYSSPIDPLASVVDRNANHVPDDGAPMTRIPRQGIVGKGVTKTVA